MRYASTILIAIGLVACVDPLKLEIESGDGALVIDGLITDQPGPYNIKLSRSITFNNSRPLRVFVLPERAAVVTVTSDAGERETLVEQQPGTYRISAIKGRVGRSYTVEIRTTNGRRYISQPETILPVPGIDNLEYQFATYDRGFLNANGQFKTTKAVGFNIYVSTTDRGGRGDCYRWQCDAIFEFFSVTNNPDIKQCWAPVSRLETSAILNDDRDVEGQKFRKFVCTVPYDRPTKYMVKMRQQSLTPAACAYWSNLSTQQLATGSIFDPPPTTVPGNIRSTTEGYEQEVVLGFFGASSITNKDVVFDRLKAAGFVGPSPYIEPQQGDCRNHVPNATNIKPDGF